MLAIKINFVFEIQYTSNLVGEYKLVLGGLNWIKYRRYEKHLPISLRTNM